MWLRFVAIAQQRLDPGRKRTPRHEIGVGAQQHRWPTPPLQQGEVLASGAAQMAAASAAGGGTTSSSVAKARAAVPAPLRDR